MNLIDDLLNSLREDAPVREVLTGAHWTVVCSRHCGMASTILGDKPHGHDRVREVGNLLALSARELAEYARSEVLLEASLGLAAINSLVEVDAKGAVEMNALEVLLERGAGKPVALVGHFPFIPKLRQAAGRLYVLEEHPAEGEYPAEAAAD